MAVTVKQSDAHFETVFFSKLSQLSCLMRNFHVDLSAKRRKEFFYNNVEIYIRLVSDTDFFLEKI